MIDKIGGKDNVRERVDLFDDLIESLPQGGAIIDKHRQGHRLLHLRPAQFGVLSGFIGGRRCYHERNGQMNLSDIHADIAITRPYSDHTPI